MMEKVKLTGSPEKSVTWIWLQDGHFKIECYDFSELAQNMFGNDIAYTLTVGPGAMAKLYSLAKQDQDSLLDWAASTFQSYFEIKHWLDQNHMEYTRNIESWA